MFASNTIFHRACTIFTAGIKGIVQDGDGNAIEGAMVYITGREAHPLITTALGEFWRLQLPGQYELVVRKLVLINIKGAVCLIKNESYNEAL